MEQELCFDQWGRISRTLDFILKQEPTKVIKESPGSFGVRGEPYKPARKPRKGKEQPVEQLKLF